MKSGFFLTILFCASAASAAPVASVSPEWGTVLKAAVHIPAVASALPEYYVKGIMKAPSDKNPLAAPLVKALTEASLDPDKFAALNEVELALTLSRAWAQASRETEAEKARLAARLVELIEQKDAEGLGQALAEYRDLRDAGQFHYLTDQSLGEFKAASTKAEEVRVDLLLDAVAKRLADSKGAGEWLSAKTVVEQGYLDRGKPPVAAAQKALKRYQARLGDGSLQAMRRQAEAYEKLESQVKTSNDPLFRETVALGLLGLVQKDMTGARSLVPFFGAQNMSPIRLAAEIAKESGSEIGQGLALQALTQLDVGFSGMERDTRALLVKAGLGGAEGVLDQVVAIAAASKSPKVKGLAVDFLIKGRDKRSLAARQEALEAVSKIVGDGRLEAAQAAQIDFSQVAPKPFWAASVLRAAVRHPEQALVMGVGASALISALIHNTKFFLTCLVITVAVCYAIAAFSRRKA